MEYLALIHADDDQWESMSESDRQAVYGRYMEFSRNDKVVGGAELQSTKTAIRMVAEEEDTELVVP